MRKTIGYMITWTTYGSWLQGEEKGYVKDGKILRGNEKLKEANQAAMVREKVKLSKREKGIVEKAILESAKRFGQKILAVSVYSNHVHVVAKYVDVPISAFVGYCKNAARTALNEAGIEGKIWTHGYDKRFCFDEKHLKAMIEYVKRHGEEYRKEYRMSNAEQGMSK